MDLVINFQQTDSVHRMEETIVENKMILLNRFSAKGPEVRLLSKLFSLCAY